MTAKKSILVTGLAGFAGSYLGEVLLSKGYKVHGILGPGETIDNIKHIKNDLRLDRGDITKADKLAAYIKKVKPYYVFHLAAMSSVRQSIKKEKLTYDVNFNGTMNLYSALASLSTLPKKVILVSSSDCYGIFKPSDRLLKEDMSLNPISPYAISKAAGEYLSHYYLKQYRLPITITRAFNHTGPRQSDVFVIPSFARQIAEIEAGLEKPIMNVGNLAVKRDLSDVRDIVIGYYRMAVKGKPGEVYNLCSGTALSIRELLNKLRRLSFADIKVKVDKSRFRKADIPVLRGDNSRARKQLGWKPGFELEETLRDTLIYWREKVL